MQNITKNIMKIIIHHKSIHTKDELPTIKEHMKSKGYKSFSGYVKDLIEKDMQGTSGINVKTNKGNCSEQYTWRYQHKINII